MHILSECNFAYSNPSLQYQTVHGLRGLVATCRILKDELLAAVPITACVAPHLISTSAKCAALEKVLLERYSAVVDDQWSFSMKFPNTVLCAYTAMAMRDGPLAKYLSSIVVERVPEDEIQQHLGPKLFDAYRGVRAAEQQVLSALHADANNASSVCPRLSLEELSAAHDICKSRVLDVPGGDEILGGAAIVPWFDLINHSFSNPNIECAVVPRSELPGGAANLFDVTLNHFVIGVSATMIEAGDMLHYPYMDYDHGDEDILTWALRFHFVPHELRKITRR